MLQPKYLCVILAKMVVPAVVPPTRMIRPIPHPINIPPKWHLRAFHPKQSSSLLLNEEIASS